MPSEKRGEQEEFPPNVGGFNSSGGARCPAYNVGTIFRFSAKISQKTEKETPDETSTRINILDLVQVANGFGKSTPNGDGAVNILDLFFVAQHFSE